MPEKLAATLIAGDGIDALDHGIEAALLHKWFDVRIGYL
jgi:alcohol dehydrogenase class IV